MKIFVLEGIHFTVPGRARTLFLTREEADKEAAALTNDLREWVELPGDATAKNWQEKLKEARLQRAEDQGIEIDEISLSEDPIGEALGDENGDVWITEEELVGAGRFVPERTDAEIVRETNDLARICLTHMGYSVNRGQHKFYDDENPRSKQAWQHACEIMEHMTATDPNDALANLDGEDEPAASAKVSPFDAIDLVKKLAEVDISDDAAIATLIGNARVICGDPTVLATSEPDPADAWALTAGKEGWGVFDCGDGSEIEKDDEAGIFESDDDATEFVLAKARAGSKPHIAAIQFVNENRRDGAEEIVI